MVYCCVPLCSSGKGKQEGVTFHEFPSDSLTYKLWCTNIAENSKKHGILWTPRERPVICSKHFTDYDFSVSTVKKRLLPRVVPTVFPIRKVLSDLASFRTHKYVRLTKKRQRAGKYVEEYVYVNDSALCHKNIESDEEDFKGKVIKLKSDSATKSENLSYSSDEESEFSNKNILRTEIPVSTLLSKEQSMHEKCITPLNVEKKCESADKCLNGTLVNLKVKSINEPSRWCIEKNENNNVIIDQIFFEEKLADKDLTKKIPLQISTSEVTNVVAEETVETSVFEPCINDNVQLTSQRHTKKMDLELASEDDLEDDRWLDEVESCESFLKTGKSKCRPIEFSNQSSDCEPLYYNNKTQPNSVKSDQYFKEKEILSVNSSNSKSFDNLYNDIIGSNTGVPESKKILFKLRKTINRLQHKIKQLKKQKGLNQLKLPEDVREKMETIFENSLNGEPRALFLLEQIKAYGKEKIKYDSETLKNCMYWNRVSPAGYECVRALNILHLPHPRSLRNYMEEEKPVDDFEEVS